MNIGTSKAYPFHNDGGDEDDDSVHAQMDTILTTLVMPFIISKEVKAFAKCVSLNPGGYKRTVQRRRSGDIRRRDVPSRGWLSAAQRATRTVFQKICSRWT